MVTVNLYGIPNCNNVKKARDWLNKHGVDYVFHDFKKIDVCEILLTNWLSQVSHERLINRTSLTWRGLDQATKLSLQDSKSNLQNTGLHSSGIQSTSLKNIHLEKNSALIKLMQTKPMVIKRPILEKNGKIVSVGFDAQHYAQICKT